MRAGDAEALLRRLRATITVGNRDPRTTLVTAKVLLADHLQVIGVTVSIELMHSTDASEQQWPFCADPAIYGGHIGIADELW